LEYSVNSVANKIKANINIADATKTGGFVFLKNKIGFVFILCSIEKLKFIARFILSFLLRNEKRSSIERCNCIEKTG
jgi:hypothetical protein